ncbi:hypothetical protein D3C78_1804680 [compost metagenome]
MTTELHHQPRIQRIQPLQRITHVQTGYRTARTFKNALTGRCKGYHRAMEALLDA